MTYVYPKPKANNLAFKVDIDYEDVHDLNI